ncbi:STAS domain-containing protein [Streptomyces chiangmaiensis]|uniref:Anti-sigma factor antagonist n=1 Tax=Streptomyces chiangmaiensis TaxID=766497 RepID=A0ABU7FQW1_9ACTN|nr:STAS domain-containing protein [Streptomyces chiangmaiensis]MED7826502.1 STAS domain-containing protein [Streptomyces chiangmaiensis]
MTSSLIQNDRVTIRHDVINGWSVVEIDGEVDAHTAPLICEVVCKLLHEGHHHLVLDFRLVRFIDSMGLRMVVAITKRIRDSQGSLRMACASSRTLKVFEFTGLDDAFEFYDSPEEATRRRPSADGLASWPRS